MRAREGVSSGRSATARPALLNKLISEDKRGEREKRGGEGGEGGREGRRSRGE